MAPHSYKGVEMTLDQAVWVLLVTAIVLANIPWILSNRLFIWINVANKPIWLGLAEWFTYFIVMGGLALALEYGAMGNIAPQEWEFYVINLFLFMIFAFPGFIYRYSLKMYLDKSKNTSVEH